MACFLRRTPIDLSGLIWYNVLMDTSVLPNTNSVDKVNHDIAEKVAEQNAQRWGFPYINLAEFPINADFIKFLSEAEAREAEMIVFDKKGKTLDIAVNKPANEAAKKIAETLTTAGFTLEFFVCSPESLQKALKIYQSTLVQKKSVKISHHIDEEKNSLESNSATFAELEKKNFDGSRGYHAQRNLFVIRGFAGIRYTFTAVRQGAQLTASSKRRFAPRPRNTA